MKLTREQTEDEVTERLFELEVEGERVPGVVWTPAGARGPRPLLLLAHGGGQHKLMPPLAAGAKRYAKTLRWAVAALDAPFHGDRGPAQLPVAELIEVMKRRAEGAAREWRRALEALQALPEIGTGQPVGFQGLSLGAQIGLRVVADEAKVTAGVLGLVGDEALLSVARRITAPLTFVVQWDDELVSRDASLALYAAVGSKEKSLHANPGGHIAVPPFERSTWESFFTRHLGQGP